MKISLYLFVILVTNFALSTGNNFKRILDQKITYIDKIHHIKGRDRINFKTEFASPEIVNPENKMVIEGLIITKIQLVFTTFRKAESFNQESLNYQRLVELQNLMPSIFKNSLIEWEIIAQTSCISPKYGDDYFHGFIIKYRPSTVSTAIEVASLRSELSKLEKADIKDSTFRNKLISSAKKTYVGGVGRISVPTSLTSRGSYIIEQLPYFKNGEEDLNNYLKNNVTYSSTAIRNEAKGNVYLSFVVRSTGEIDCVKPLQGIGSGCVENVVEVIKEMPDWNPGIFLNRPDEYTVRLVVNFSIKDNEITLKSCRANYKFTEASRSSYIDSFLKSSSVFSSDSTVFNVFNRNNDWDKILVVCDFTGSMSPYTAQLLIWHKLNIKVNREKINHFTFFNDGNNTPDASKVIGKTGGIYHGRLKDFEDVKALAIKTTSAGGGGDAPENNIEATLKGISSCPDCESVVMIADNFTTPRDMSLLEKVNKPIHVIVCGASMGVNVVYLNIARKTGGSLHTIENDISNLMDLNEGEDIEIGNQTFRIEDGRFIEIYGM